MSHFFTVVLVPASALSQDIEAKVSELLAPFDEEIEVPEYQRECWCLSSVARHHARTVAEAKVGKLGDFRKRYWELPDPKPEWMEFIKEYLTCEEEAEKAHPLYGKPNPECSECHGTGTYPSTYNPRSKWDWWRIGGRWDGEIQGNRRDDGEGGFNFGDDHKQLRHNIALVSDLKPDFSCFAILTPEGEWIERGAMGWWGVVSGEKDAEVWQEQIRTVFAKYRDCIAVGCDLHI